MPTPAFARFLRGNLPMRSCVVPTVGAIPVVPKGFRSSISYAGSTLVTSSMRPFAGWPAAARGLAELSTGRQKSDFGKIVCLIREQICAHKTASLAPKRKIGAVGGLLCHDVRLPSKKLT